jgi:DNA repair protein RadC
MKTLNLELPCYRLSDQGFNSLSDADTLSLIIGGNQLDKCRNLMTQVNNNLRELAKFSLTDLIEAGLTQREAQAIASALEIGRRKNLSEAMERKQIKCSKDAADIFQPILADLQHEEFYALLLNRSNKIIKRIKLSQGGISGTVTDVRVIMKQAISCLASGIIVCHNHPSGNLNPSECDTKITQKIKETSALMDMQLLDHIIISEKDYYSYADNGLL